MINLPGDSVFGDFNRLRGILGHVQYALQPYWQYR